MKITLTIPNKLYNAIDAAFDKMTDEVPGANPGEFRRVRRIASVEAYMQQALARLLADLANQLGIAEPEPDTVKALRKEIEDRQKALEAARFDSLVVVEPPPPPAVPGS
jgi:hypothetical protein